MLALTTSITSACLAQFRSQTLSYPLGVSMLDANNAFLVGFEFDQDSSTAYLMKRTSSTANFTIVKTLPNAEFTACHFFNSQTGLICGSTPAGVQVWRTTDGGQTLTAQLLSASAVSSGFDFYFTSSTVGYLSVGNTLLGDGEIFKTTNAGVSWTPVAGSESVYLTDLDFLTENLAYRVSNDSLDRTRNGAANWQRVNIPAQANTIDFLTEQLGYLGAKGGGIYKTTNGGTTWTRLTTIPTTAITSIKFPTPSVGYVVSEDGDVFRTADAGITWRSIYVGSENAPFSMATRVVCLNENTVVGLGIFTVISTTNAATTPAAALSTVFLSGSAENCSGTLKTLMELTGVAPWQVVLTDNMGTQQTVTATQTPFEWTYTPPTPSNADFEFTPLSSRGANQTVATEAVGGKSMYKVPQLKARFIRPINDTFCYNTSVPLPIHFEGCAPWSFVMNEDTFFNIYAQDTVINYRITHDVDLHLSYVRLERGNATAQWSHNGVDSFTNALLTLKAPPSSFSVNFLPQPNILTGACLGDTAVFSIELGGLPPFDYTLTNGLDSIVRRTASFSDTIYTPVKRTGNWYFVRATDGCGASIDTNSTFVEAHRVPNKPTNLSFSFLQPTDSVQITWRDNNTQSNDDLIYLDISDHFSTTFDLGIEGVKLDFVNFFRANTAFETIFIGAISLIGCPSKEDSIKVPTALALLERGTYPQLPAGTGLAFADVNNDNLPDILTADGISQNMGSFSFQFRPNNFGGTPSVVGDIDNDGDLDFLVNNPTDSTTKVYVNGGNFNFTLLQTVSGIAATFFDYDFDGFLDIACTDKMYRRVGSVFQLVPLSCPIIGRPYYYTFNESGRMGLIDVALNSQYGMEFCPILFNEADSTWERGGSIGYNYFAGIAKTIAWGDVLGKGNEDFAFFPTENLNAQGTRLDYVAPPLSFFPHNGFSYQSTLYNRPVNVASYRGEGMLLDLNNSGDLEAFVGGQRLSDILPGAQDYQGSVDTFIPDGAPAAADLDNDGDLDIAVALPQGGFKVVENVLKNNSSRWLKLKLVGTIQNRACLGTLAKMYYTDTAGQKKVIAQTVGARHGGLSRSDIVLHFGLGKTAVIDSVVVFWTIEKRTILRGITTNQILTISEANAVTLRPNGPRNLTIALDSNNLNSWQLNFEDNAHNERGFVVQRSTTASDTGFVTIDSLSANVNWLSTPLVPNLRPVYFRVFAYNSVGNSAFSNVASILPPQLCSSRPTAGNIESSSFACGKSRLLSTGGTARGLGIVYQWQKSSTSVSEPWVNISNSDTTDLRDTSFWTLTHYRLIVKCNPTATADTSRVWTATAIEPTFATLPYSTSFENWRTAACTLPPIASNQPDEFWQILPEYGPLTIRASNNLNPAESGWPEPQFGLYNPTRTDGLRSARFHSSRALPRTFGTMELRVNLSSLTDKSLQFDHINSTGNDSLMVQLSEDAGQTFTTIAAYGRATTWTRRNLPLSSLATRGVILFKFIADHGNDDIGMDNLSITIDTATVPITAIIQPTAPCNNRLGKNIIRAEAANGVAPYRYRWSTGDTTQTVVDVPVGTYRLTITDAQNRQAVAPDLTVTTCVWAGDTDTSGVADGADLLNIGLHFGEQGAVRCSSPNVDSCILWRGMSAANWSKQTAAATNLKHVDTNGDGIINANDTLGIVRNWGLIRTSRPQPEILNIPPIFVQTTRIGAGQSVAFPIILGSSALPADNIYGLVFNVKYDPSVIDASTVYMTQQQSWLGNNRMAIYKNNPQNGLLSVAITKTDKLNTNGLGQIATLHFKTKATLMGLTTTNFAIENPLVINNAAQPIPVSASSNNTTITVGTSEPLWANQILIAPNPTTGLFNVSTQHIKIEKLTLYDIVGKVLWRTNIDNQQAIPLSIETAGTYLLKIETEKGVLTRKVVVAF